MLSEKETTADSGSPVTLPEHIVEVVSDSGEGAQTVGQSFGTLSAQMGNGIWTVEIIPAEIEPPPRDAAGASGIRIRFGSKEITNMGNEADLIVAFNEQALMGRVDGGNIKQGATILLEDKWRTHASDAIRKDYITVYNRLVEDGYRIIEIPMEEETLKIVKNPRRGKNMFVFGLLCYIYTRDLDLARRQIRTKFKKKGEKVITPNLALLESGYNWAKNNLDFHYAIPSAKAEGEKIVTNGNVALGLGIMASGMDVCAMYPITPATSVSHYLSEVFENAGGVVHQAEDEIAACAFAIGSSYAGKCAVTVTSGPGLALKTELLGLASMAEIPLVLIDVQRGGPSTGLPTKVEQGDLLAALYASAGDNPKVVLAPSTIEDCFYSVITARKIAETFRMPVLILSDANLATGQQPYDRPVFNPEWLAPPIDQSPLPEGFKPFDWDEETGLSRRPIPGQKNGLYRVTGLAHTDEGKVAYDMDTNQSGSDARSKKLITLQKTLKTPQVYGDEEGDILILGWGSTKGSIQEAVDLMREDGLSVSALHLKFLQPMASGIGDIMKKFKKVIAVEINYSDDKKNPQVNMDNRRYSNLAWILRARYLVDIDSFSNVHGQPLKPGDIVAHIQEEFKALAD